MKVSDLQRIIKKRGLAKILVKPLADRLLKNEKKKNIKIKDRPFYDDYLGG